MPSELITTEQARARMQRSNTDLRVPAFRVYHNQSSSASACTVAVTSSALVLVITGGSNAGTYTYTLSSSANDTIGELVAVLNAAGRGFVAVADTYTSAASTDLLVSAAASCYGSGAEQTLYITDNYLIREIIRGVSDAVENVCGRVFASTSYAEWHNGDGTEWLALRHTPVTAITYVATDVVDAVTVRNTSTTHSLATVYVSSSAVVCKHIDSSGSATVTSTSTASAIISTVVAAINAIGSGWTATAVTGYGTKLASLLRPMGAMNALTGTATLQVPDVPADDYEADLAGGRVRLLGFGFPPGIGNIYCEYTGGYSTIPYGVQEVVASLTAQTYNTIRTGEGVIGGSTTGVQFTRDNAMATVHRPEVLDRLSPWIRHRVA